jgi:hypothetical protein
VLIDSGNRRTGNKGVIYSFEPVTGGEYVFYFITQECFDIWKETIQSSSFRIGHLKGDRKSDTLTRSFLLSWALATLLSTLLALVSVSDAMYPSLAVVCSASAPETSSPTCRDGTYIPVS